jgi:DNA-binding MarR family transcriptional regulator
LNYLELFQLEQYLMDHPAAILPSGTISGMSPQPQRDLVTAVGLLFEAANYLQRSISDDLERETGLPGTWFETLVRLHRGAGHATRMNEIAAQVAFPPSSFSRLIDRMEAERLVERVPDPTNRRATLIQATAVGEDRLAEALAVHERSAQVHFADCLSEKEIDALDTITRKLRDANAAGRAIRSRKAHPQDGTAVTLPAGAS